MFTLIYVLGTIFRRAVKQYNTAGVHIMTRVQNRIKLFDILQIQFAIICVIEHHERVYRGKSTLGLSDYWLCLFKTIVRNE